MIEIYNGHALKAEPREFCNGMFSNQVIIFTHSDNTQVRGFDTADEYPTKEEAMLSAIRLGKDIIDGRIEYHTIV